jgi:hypothetical protein
MKKLFNKLIRVDIFLLIGIVLFFVVQREPWHGIFSGFAAGCLLISIMNHIAYYRQTKKLY